LISRDGGRMEGFTQLGQGSDFSREVFTLPRKRLPMGPLC
jgi:hypothetical protein